VLTQGLFDSVCAGILLFLGFTMLSNDFKDDLLRERGAARGRGGPSATPALKAHLAGAVGWAMFLALWAGAIGMALLGYWL
jgi:zinc transporter 1/2/3